MADTQPKFNGAVLAPSLDNHQPDEWSSSLPDAAGAANPSAEESLDLHPGTPAGICVDPISPTSLCSPLPSPGSASEERSGASPSTLPRDLNQSLERLERNSLEVKLYLDSIEEKISRMEPRLQQMHAAAQTAPDQTAPGQTVPDQTARDRTSAAPPRQAAPSVAADPLRTTYSLQPAVPAYPTPFDAAEALPNHRRRRYDSVDDVVAARRQASAFVASPSPEDTLSDLKAWLSGHRRQLAVAGGLLLLGTVALVFGTERGTRSATSTTSTSVGRPSSGSQAGGLGTPMPPAAAGSTIPKSPAGTAFPQTSSSPAVPSPGASAPSAAGNSSSSPIGSIAPAPVSPAPVPSLAAPPGGPTISAASPTRSALPLSRVRVSSGVMAGHLLASSPPQYPGGLAGLFHTEGNVTMQAVISRSGKVENLHVLSGHHLLRSAAQECVRTWRYRPFLIKGTPVEVATIITVEFHR